ncbi:hypothetical protein JI58_03845 [Marinosulfonomonas sp. PRT-SC04]|nr:hypothetical protein JI58_03845 [Marinosulfonomonas sp. PRT-SC04]
MTNPIDTTSASPTHMTNSKGHQVPVSLVSDQDKLIDQTVKVIQGHSQILMSQIARFRAHSFDDVNSLMALLAEKYEVKRGGPKGNVSFISFDGLTKIEIRVQDYIVFGPELQIAKALLDEYIAEVSDGIPDIVRELLNHAFDVEKVGHVNRAKLYSLRRLNIDHPTWKRAMDAITDSMRVLESREFFQISTRKSSRDGFKAMPINLANAVEIEND